MRLFLFSLLLFPFLCFGQFYGGTVTRIVSNEITGQERGISLFGDFSTIQPEQQVAVDFIYSERPQIHETYTGTGGTLTYRDGKLVLQSGTSVGGYALMRSKQFIRYKPGQAARAMFTVLFDTPVALSAQRAGLITAENELSFGYDGLNFGILHRRDCRIELYRLDITTASSGSTTDTVVLNGVKFPIALTNATKETNAGQIANGTYTGWDSEQLDTTVTFWATAIGNKTDTFYFKGATAAGTMVKLRDGKACTDTWIYQDDWNVDKFDGTGHSGKTLNPQKFNVYKISFQWLGAGMLSFYIEDSLTGAFQNVHNINYSGTDTNSSLQIPSFPLSWFSASLGSTTNLEMQAICGSAFSDGKNMDLGVKGSIDNLKTGITTTSTNIVSIRPLNIYDDKFNWSLIKVTSLSLAAEANANKTTTFEVILNPTVGGTQNWQELTGQSVVYDIAGTTVTGGETLFTFQLPKSGAEFIDLNKYNLEIKKGDVLVIAARSTGTSEATASIGWIQE